LNALFARFDKRGAGKVRFETFREIYTPKECLYSDLLERKTAVAQPRKQAISLETRALMTRALRKQIDMEITVDAIKRRLFYRPNFNLSVIFDIIDRKRHGALSVEDVRAFLKDNGCTPTEKDLSAILQRYDRNSDGRISYEDFRQEL
jgi:Ca2+-binding EF-hand superfamily protein